MLRGSVHSIHTLRRGTQHVLSSRLDLCSRGLATASTHVNGNHHSDVGKIIKSKYVCPELQSPTVEKPFSKFILDRMETFGDDPAIVNGSAPNEPGHTFRTLHSHIYRTAETLRSQGFARSQCLAVVSPNHIDYFTPVLAAGLLGGHSTSVNPQYTEKEIAYQLGLTSASVVFAHSSCLEKVLGAVALAKLNCKVYTLDNNTAGLKGSICSLNELIAGTQLASVDKDSFINKNFNSNDIFMIPFSSGTTGSPKGVMVSHRNAISNVLQLLTVDSNYIRNARLVPLPYFHAFGVLSIMTNHYIGGKTVFMTAFDLERCLQLLQEHKVDRCGLVPPIILALAKHPIVSKYDLSALRTIGCGAAPLGAEIQRAAGRRLKCVVKQGWGMTELSAVGAIFPDELAHSLNDDAPCLGSVGVLVPGSEAKIVDPATGKDLSPYEEGEICIRGPHMMKGYYRNEEATRQTIDTDGWLHTGDIGKFDQEEFLYITDRCKELIKYKAFQVAPAELEALINTMEGVQDCVVIPVADEEAGEVPRAYVVKQPDSKGQALTEKEVEDFVAKNVSAHKRLRGGVRFTDVIPKSPAGKILRRVQRDIDRALDNKASAK
jgi:acyl-CoA synthetase (AMP-forming)/AMP-acid ligase II